MNQEVGPAEVKARIRTLVLREASRRRPAPPSCAERRNRKRPHRYFGGNPYAGMSTQIWVTKPILRARGWTDTAIRDFLPRPERYKTNPYPEGGKRPMALWSAETVGRAEGTVAWRQWLRESLKRRRVFLEDLADVPLGNDFRRRVKAVDAAITAFQRADATRHRPKPPNPDRRSG